MRTGDVPSLAAVSGCRRRPGAGLGRAGVIWGRLAIALYLLSLGLAILSFVGWVKPLI